MECCVRWNEQANVYPGGRLTFAPWRRVRVGALVFALAAGVEEAVKQTTTQDEMDMFCFVFACVCFVFALFWSEEAAGW